jgi:hypothetical protein
MAPVPVGGADVAAAIAKYAPRSLSGEVAAFARRAVEAPEPKSPARAKALLFAAGRLGTFATSVGLELDPSVVLHPSLIERFIVTRGAALGAATRRTLRSNLRFLAAANVANAPPAPVPLSRERAKAPYAPAEICAYLALADAQPTLARRMRLSGLIVLGAGAGLMGADLRAVVGTDVIARSGGVLIEVKRRRARVVPLLARYHERALASASFAPDPPKTPLPEPRPPTLLRPTLGGRALQRDGQGPRLKRHFPRLVPPHGADLDEAHAHVSLRRAQSAGPGLLRGPRGRRPTTAGPRTRATNPPAQAHDDFRPGQYRLFGS